MFGIALRRLLSTSAATTAMTSHFASKGQLNFPGITASSKRFTEELVHKDAAQHHCYTNQTGFHNHLAHHVLVAYDLGAPPPLLQKIYDENADGLRPRILHEKDKTIKIDDNNWFQHLGIHNQGAYNAYVDFFGAAIQEHGVPETLERYVFSPEANEDGRKMLLRLVSGAVHPFIHTGYGLEFGDNDVVAAGLAEACVHSIVTGTEFTVATAPSAPEESISLLELLRRVYDSDILKPPMPYDAQTLLTKRLKDATAGARKAEIERLCALYHIPSTPSSDSTLSKITDEIIWVATLLMASTSRRGKTPRIDFFLMHFVTSSLFLKPFVKTLRKQEDKAALIRAYVPNLIMYSLARGRPRIDAELAMGYTASPGPPSSADVGPVSESNPWPEIVNGALLFPEAHLPKTIRTLLYGAVNFGDTPAGEVIGTYRPGSQEETHKGMSKVDGTLFVRAAGLVLDRLGWVGHGQAAKNWDFSALGYDDAWKEN